jgi:polyisoprenoid-binding protein YceI
MRLIALLAALAAPAFCAEYTLQLTPDNTRIEWTLDTTLHTIHGTFELKRGSIKFDPDSGKATGEVVVDTASGDSGGGARDGRMHKSILQSSKYPELVFTPDRIEGKLAMPGTSNLKLHGMFRIHGADHELTMDVQAKLEPARINAEITFAVPYVAWGMKNPSTLVLRVGKQVQIAIHATTAYNPSVSAGELPAPQPPRYSPSVSAGELRVEPSQP